MKVVCYGTYERNKYLDDFKTLKEAKEFVFKHIKDHQKSSYTRGWYEPELKSWVIDYGSWSDFYFIVDYDYKKGDML